MRPPEQARGASRARLLAPDDELARGRAAWSLLREGRGRDALLELYRPIADSSRLARLDADDPLPWLGALLAEHPAWQERPTRWAATRALADGLESGELSGPRAQAIEAWLAAFGIARIRREGFLQALDRSASSRVAPRRGAVRGCVLFVLRQSLPTSGELDYVDAELRMQRGMEQLRRGFRLNWEYDVAHLRRYLVQYGFAGRRRDGRLYWRAESYLDAQVFDNAVHALVARWWTLAGRRSWGELRAG